MRNRGSTEAGFWLVLLAAVTAHACGGPQRASTDEDSELGTPRRIIAIAPGVTEMLFELGLGDRVAGVGNYASWPPEVESLPKLGGLFDARLEAIVDLDPDLAVLLPSEERLRRHLEEMGVEVLTVRADTIADVEEMAKIIGERCGVVDVAERFVVEFRAKLAPRYGNRPLGVLLSVTRQPGEVADVLVAGADTFLSELLARLGARNVMADLQMSYPQVGLEEIVLRHPEVVIELQAAPGNFDLLRSDWQELESNPSLSGVCVEVVAGDHVLLPGPRLPRLYEELERALQKCSSGP